MRITPSLDFIFTIVVIAVGSANIILFEMSPVFNTIQLIFILVLSARIGYNMAYNKLLGV